jgi:hypothetical protein
VSDKTDELVKELHGLKDAMVENLDKLIIRDGKIEVILQKAESLSTYSKTYRVRVQHSFPLLFVNFRQRSSECNRETEE